VHLGLKTQAQATRFIVFARMDDISSMFSKKKDNMSFVVVDNELS
jgi:hypothetical protein